MSPNNRDSMQIARMLDTPPTVETKLMLGRSDHESMKSVGELRGRQI